MVMAANRSGKWWVDSNKHLNTVYAKATTDKLPTFFLCRQEQGYGLVSSTTAQPFLQTKGLDALPTMIPLLI